MGRSVDRQRSSNTDTTGEFQRLRRDFVEGRITLAELEDRLEQVQLSPEAAEPLDGLTTPPRSRVPAHPSRHGDEVGAHVRSYLLVMAMLVGIWALTGTGYFWPIWPMMGWGIGVASHMLGLREGCHSDEKALTPQGRSNGKHIKV